METGPKGFLVGTFKNGDEVETEIPNLALEAAAPKKGKGGGKKKGKGGGKKKKDYDSDFEEGAEDDGSQDADLWAAKGRGAWHQQLPEC